MKICHYQGCNDIGVVTATKWRHYLFYFSNNSRHWEPYKIIQRSFFSPIWSPRCSWSLSKMCKSVIEIFWGEVFIVINTVRKGVSWCLAVICRKRSAFDMQFNLVVVLIYLKTCVKDRRDSSASIARKKDLISMYQGALVSRLVNISVYFTLSLIHIWRCRRRG